MDAFPRESLIEDWYERIEELQAKEKEIEANQDSGDKYERAEPRIQQDRIRSCIEELEQCTEMDDVLAVLGSWRDEVEDRQKRILDKREWFRNDVKRRQLADCVEELTHRLPEDVFDECYCGELKMPTEDQRYSEGFRWECVNDDCFR